MKCESNQCWMNHYLSVELALQRCSTPPSQHWKLLATCILRCILRSLRFDEAVTQRIVGVIRFVFRPHVDFDVVCESLDCSTWKKFSYRFEIAWIRLLLSHVTRKTKWTKGETQIQAFNAAKMPSCWASYSFWWLNQFSDHQETAHFWATASGHSQLSTTMVSSHPFSALPTLH